MSRMTSANRLLDMTRRLSPYLLLVLAGCARHAEPRPGTGGDSAPEEKQQESAPAAPAPAPAAEQAPAAATEGSALDAPKTTQEEGAEPSTLDQAEAALSLAERELDSALAPGSGAGAEKRGSGTTASPCERTCRAFASLSRAAAAVCRLEQPNAQRCARANDAVGRARPRVASCACSS